MRHSEYYERGVDGEASESWMGERTLSSLYTGSDCFVGPLHHERAFQSTEDEEHRPTWRSKDRLKTSGVALVLCLNLGTDPPNMSKPNPCARKECWFDPSNVSKLKGLEIIGNALQHQYEKLQPKSKYKQCLDPTMDELRRICVNLRKQAHKERLLFHYNGHGVPRPTANGELWTFGKNYTFYMPVSVLEIKSWLGDPAVYVIDCSGAGILIPFFLDPMKRKNDFEGDYGAMPKGDSENLSDTSSSIVLAACRAEETLPTNPQYPADIFTACLTTPITIASRWFMLNNPHSMSEINLDLAENMPGRESERKSPRGELYWIFTAITDTIAWSILPSQMFLKMFRQDLLVASLFRNFLLAKRLMKGMRCNPQSNPPVPDCSSHPLWQIWDYALETGLLQVAAETKGVLRMEPSVSPWYVDMGVVAGGSGSSAYIDSASAAIGATSASGASAGNSLSAPFFGDMLTAFETWLDFGGGSASASLEEKEDMLSTNAQFPLYLPIILQILLSQTYRARALNLLLRYISKGPWAVNSALLVGIFPYIIKLLPSASAELRQYLVAIWTYIIAFDHSCRGDLVKDKHHSSFISWMANETLSVTHRCMSAFVICEICNCFREGQQVCLNSGLHKTINQLIVQPDVLASAVLKKWIALCLGKLCENFVLAKYMFISEVGHLQFHQLLTDTCPNVRAATVSSLGELFGASQGNLIQSNGIAGASTHFQSFGGFGSVSAPSGFLLSSGMPPPAPMGPLRSTSASGFKPPQVEVPHVATLPPSAGKQPSGGAAVLEQFELRQSELQLASYIMERMSDGSAVVRREAVIALSKLLMVPCHWPCIKLIAKFISDYHNRLYRGDFCANVETSANLSKTEEPSTGAANRPRKPSAPIPVAQDTSSVGPGFGPGRDMGPHQGSTPSSSGRDPNGATPKASSTKKGSSYQQFPWLLPSSESKKLIAEVEQHLIDEGVLLIFSGGTLKSKMLENGIVDDETASYYAGLTAMATSYIRLWLSLREMQYKDSHPRIVKTICSVMSYVNAQIEVDDSNVVEERDTDDWGGGNNETSNAHGSPIRDHNFSMVSPSRLNLKAMSGSSSPGGSPKGSPCLPAMNGKRVGRGGGDNSSSSWLIANGDTMTVSACMMSDPLLQSGIYRWSRKQFLQPDVGQDEELDILSLKGQELLFKENQLNAALKIAKKISLKYRSADSKSNMDSYDRPAMNTDLRNNVAESPNSALPSTLSNFQPKAIFIAKNSEMTTHVMFHGLKNVLAICDGVKVGIWSLDNGNNLGTVDRRVVNNSNLSSHYATMTSSTPTGPSTSPSLSRITSLQWINQATDSLLLTGGDDGTVHIWRDDLGNSSVYSSSEADSTSADPSASLLQASDTNKGGNQINPSLAACFTAMPDTAASSRGSGMISDWQQHSGVLAVGGNSETIRLWDVNREQCTRVLYTGVSKCTTALTCRSVAWKNSSMYGDSSEVLSQSYAGLDRNEGGYWSWVFAGFGDGTVAVFDQKVPSQGGRVHSARDDKHWIVSAYVREDVPEVVVGALYGGVKFWDLRTMRVFKTIEVHKSPLTAMAMHNCAPIVSTGSHKQFIKILTLSGDLLSMIRYHDGFLGQRIAPVSCLAFHPHKMLLAAGSTDQIVAVYAPTEKFEADC